MYIDNELSVTERTEVENFVAQNPDLAIELKMFQQVTLEDEKMLFEQKDLLFKKENLVTKENYEEYFLLSVDNELSATENDEVEKFVLQHPQLQNEFTLLQKTRLEPENLVFRDKKILYRKEERRVVPIFWLRISAAAAIIGIVSLTWFFTYNNQSSSDNVAVEISENAARPLPKKAADNVIDNAPVAALPAKEETSSTTATNAAAIINETKIAEKVVAVEQRERRTRQVKTAPADNNVAEIKRELSPINVSKIADEPDMAVQKTIINEGRPRISGGNETTPKNTFIREEDAEEKQSVAKNAVYREIDTNQEDERTFYIGSAQINKNKLKGLFKKAAGFFEKKDRNDDDEKTIQIAGFEIKSK